MSKLSFELSASTVRTLTLSPQLTTVCYFSIYITLVPEGLLVLTARANQIPRILLPQ